MTRAHQSLQQCRHVLVDLSWVSQEAGQDEPPNTSLRFDRGDNLEQVTESFNHTILKLIYLHCKLLYLDVHFASLQEKFPLHGSSLVVRQTGELLCLQYRRSY